MRIVYSDLKLSFENLLEKDGTVSILPATCQKSAKTSNRNVLRYQKNCLYLSSNKWTILSSAN